jgi:hypothetical protein
MMMYLAGSLFGIFLLVGADGQQGDSNRVRPFPATERYVLTIFDFDVVLILLRVLNTG